MELQHSSRKTKKLKRPASQDFHDQPVDHRHPQSKARRRVLDQRMLSSTSSSSEVDFEDDIPSHHGYSRHRKRQKQRASPVPSGVSVRRDHSKDLLVTFKDRNHVSTGAYMESHNGAEFSTDWIHDPCFFDVGYHPPVCDERFKSLWKRFEAFWTDARYFGTK